MKSLSSQAFILYLALLPSQCQSRAVGGVIPPHALPGHSNTPAPAANVTNTTAAEAIPIVVYKTQQEIDEVCLPFYFDLCEAACQGSECCFNVDGNGCDDDFPCEDYSACEPVLYTPRIDETTDPALVAACPDSLSLDTTTADEKNGCLVACGDSGCCFGKSLERVCGSSEPGVDCSRWKACTITRGF
ncbi:expressed unknown protein [Seminavis robusta]|uniref:Uncharacterized protein n=1 Tax=Seminavis robusta TaxID=568900 RepID=A0A9N8E2Z5_9STRA|nr:expressed unknown protein [Seminavis robusta]|eukprot:Sro603_g173980.1 n/a (188) ;mRNA; f:35529-36092